MENNDFNFHKDISFKFSGKFSYIFLTVFEPNKVTHITTDDSLLSIEENRV